MRWFKEKGGSFSTKRALSRKIPHSALSVPQSGFNRAGKLAALF